MIQEYEWFLFQTAPKDGKIHARLYWEEVIPFDYSKLSKEDKLTARLSDLYFGHYNATREECTMEARRRAEEVY